MTVWSGEPDGVDDEGAVPVEVGPVDVDPAAADPAVEIHAPCRVVVEDVERDLLQIGPVRHETRVDLGQQNVVGGPPLAGESEICLLYTSDAADEL